MAKIKIKKLITFQRHSLQLLCFVFIVFGGFLGIKKQHLSFLPFVEPSKEYKQLKEENRSIIIAGPGYPQAFDTYLPVKSCRFSRQTGIFRACFIHFVSEAISWVSPLRLILPHVLLFIILAILFGRLWCGWVCPLGFIQDVLNIIRKNLKLKSCGLSEKNRKNMKVVKYGLLIVIIFLSIVSAIPIFSWDLRKQIYLSVCQMCPSRYIFPYLGGWPIVHSFIPIGYGIFTVVSIVFTLLFITSFFIKRSWCRICPSGLILSFFNRGSFLSKEKVLLKCSRCGICVNVCPLQNENVYLEKKKRNVDHPDCIHCFRCIEFCPERGCLKVKFIGKTIFKS